MAAVMLFLQQTTGKTKRHTHFCMPLEPVFTRDCGGRVHFTDEPTGALDSETSLQIMELLKEIAKDKLVIMVTHNPELAEQYSTRIVKLLDGRIVSDSNPCRESEDAAEPQKRKKISMSFFTALSLSFHNLRTKKGRTLLTAFAGSIGIIGIALILSISTGIQSYVNSIQRDTLSSYPITIQQQESAISSILNAGGELLDAEREERHQLDAVYGNDRMYDLFNAAFTGEDVQNNLEPFKIWLDGEMNAETSTTNLYEYVSAVQYQYGVQLNTYIQKDDGSYRSTDISSAVSPGDGETSQTNSAGSTMASAMTARLGNMNLWSEMLPGTDGKLISDLLYAQYDLVSGKWPEKADEVVLILDENNEITDIAFYALGLMSDEEVNDILRAVMKKEEIEAAERKITYDDILGTTFKLVVNSEFSAGPQTARGKICAAMRRHWNCWWKMVTS